MVPLLIPSCVGVLVFSGIILFDFVFVSKTFLGVLQSHFLSFTYVCGLIVLCMRARVCFVMDFCSMCFLFLFLCIFKYGFFGMVGVGKGLSYV